MNLYSTRRGEYVGEVLRIYSGQPKCHARGSALRIVQMPNGRFQIVRAEFRGQHWVERPVGALDGYQTEAAAEKFGRLISS